MICSMGKNCDVGDVIVVGAGPAGLTAAIYLGRYRRRCIVLDDGRSRARWIPTSHNIPGFAGGIGGEELLATLREQAQRYGAQICRAHASSIAQYDGVFALGTDAGVFHGRYLLLATGVKDHLPAIEGASEAVLRSVLRFCPICDAFEAIDERIAVIGDGAPGVREAEFLKNYSHHVTLLHIGSAPAPASDGIEVISVRLSDLRIDEDRITLKCMGGERNFDVAYLALGMSAQHDLARALGAQCDEHGAVRVNAHQETSVPRVYAAGDVVRGLNQVVVAAAESAIAATDIHNKLRGH